MHERNIYKTPPDFAKLAKEYESFGRYVKISCDGRGHLNFKNAEAVRELTYTLLKHDFGLSIELPLGRLIPTVPLRLNYILWIEDLIISGLKSGDEIRGIDVGCGASCIYPLLGAKLNNWKFVASEYDDLSLSYAKRNVAANNLTDTITLKKATGDTVLKNVVESGIDYEFCMCNPPFFSDRSETDGENNRTVKRPPPHSICTASDVESITQGGEVEFVKRMVKESLLLKGNVRWYTTMLGKKASLKILMQFLKDQKIPLVASTVFQQGKTTRWGLCWSFHENLQLATKKNKPSKNMNTAPFSFIVNKSEVTTQCEKEEEQCNVNEMEAVQCITNGIKKLLEDLQTKFDCKPLIEDAGNFYFVIVGEAWKNTWSHQRKRRRMEKRIKRKMQGTDSVDSNSLTAKELTSSLAPDSHTVENNGSLGTDRSAFNIELCSTSFGNTSVTENDKCYRTFAKIGAEREETSIIPGQKRAHLQTEVPGDEKSMFKFKILVTEKKNFINAGDSTIKVDVACLEGDREGLHQLFTYLKNQLHGMDK